MLTRDDLHGYQLGAIAKLVDNERYGLFLDMGLGKTIITLTALEFLLYQDLAADRVLVIAPKRVTTSVWRQEAANWDHTTGIRFSAVIGTERQRLAALKETAEVFLISRDNIAWLIAHYGGRKIPFDTIVIDESSSFKNSKSIRFRALRKVIKHVARVYILTGTPSPNTLVDLWPQIFLLDQGERLSKFITRFREAYFTYNPYSWKYTASERNKKALYDKIGDIVTSMKAEDYIDLPPVVHNFINVSFSPALKAKYKAFEREKVLELLDRDDKLTVANAAALSNKLLQFANGALYDEDRNVHKVHDLKLDALAEIIDTNEGRPILIAWTYQHDRDRILSKFKKLKPRTLDGDKDIIDWNDGKIELFLMHPASGGHGLNLQRGGSIIVWFGQTWSLELYLQLNARLHRQGQTDTCIIHHIVAEDTIDRRVIQAISNKKQTQDGLMLAVRSLIKKHKNY